MNTKILLNRLNYKLIFPQHNTNIMLRVYSIDKNEDKIKVDIEIDKSHFI